jgi:hypothetical protein
MVVTFSGGENGQFGKSTTHVYDSVLSIFYIYSTQQ